MYTIGDFITHSIIVIAAFLIVSIIASIALGVITSVFASVAIYFKAIRTLINNIINRHNHKCLSSNNEVTTIVSTDNCA